MPSTRLYRVGSLKESNGLARVIKHNHKVSEKRHEPVCRSVARESPGYRIEPFESLFLGSQIGRYVDVRRLDALVTESQSDDRKIDPRLEQMHRGAMTDDVWRHRLVR